MTWYHHRNTKQGEKLANMFFLTHASRGIELVLFQNSRLNLVTENVILVSALSCIYLVEMIFVGVQIS